MKRIDYDVCAAVVSDLSFDARVWKEVRSLTRARYGVRLIGCGYELPRPRRSSVDGVDVLEISLGSRSGAVSLVQRARTLLRLWLEIIRTRADVYHAHNIHVGPAAWSQAALAGESSSTTPTSSTGSRPRRTASPEIGARSGQG